MRSRPLSMQLRVPLFHYLLSRSSSIHLRHRLSALRHPVYIILQMLNSPFVANQNFIFYLSTPAFC